MSNHREKSATLAAVSPEEATVIAAEGYVFGYPLVLMDATRKSMTAVPRPGEKAAPVNQFLHMKAFPDYTDTKVVSPNVDTLYSTAWIDLSKEPLILSMPEMGDRYYLMQMLDAWTEVFANPGARTRSVSRADYALTGPGWTGALPGGMEEIKSPTALAWIIGRILCAGESDYAAVHPLQEKIRLTPLSAWGKPYSPPKEVPVEPGVDTQTPPPDQVAAMDAATFFSSLASLMAANPPRPADADILDQLEAIGIRAGQPFDPKSLEADVERAVSEGAKSGLAGIASGAKKTKEPKNGWEINLDTGRYGAEYMRRAKTALEGLGANLAEDATYPFAKADAEGKPLDGENRYVLRFDKGKTPPVEAFWSLTMYDDRHFLSWNLLDRYALGDRDKLKANPDGSIDILIQNESPGEDLEANWLPAPKAGFNLILRLYSPRKEVLAGKWIPPGIRRLA